MMYCPIDGMIGDYMSKLLVGAKFKKFRDLITSLSNIYHQIGQQDCIGSENVRETTTVNKSEAAVRLIV